MRYHYTPIRVAEIQKTDDTKCWRGCEAKETLILVATQNSTATLGESLAVCNKHKHSLTIQPNNCVPGCLTNWFENLCLHKNLHVNVYS